ncbi:major facilitator superfamily MFS_1 [Caldivirga maquilingensis IC-167]|uniref:Major facilitator superfamily MFS_1 n=2 Tax=Caldivirga maquilingensis TaxID=76887 RepID=A8MBX1_CALMQ|nr:major facilitator superfamily MFS_1 [Caldivirga maquilingensis IC-167]
MVDNRGFNYFMVNVLYSLVSGLIYPSFPLYLRMSGLNVEFTSYALTSMNIAGFASSIMWGRVINRPENRRIAVLIGTIGGGLGYLTLAYIKGTLTIIAALVVLSIIAGGIYPTVMTLISETGGVEHMGYFWAGGSIGYAITTSFAGYVLEHMGIRPLFIISAIIYVSSAAILLNIVNYSTHRKPSDHATPLNTNDESFTLSLSALYIVSVFILLFIDAVKNLYMPMFYVYEANVNMAYATATLSVEAFLEVPFIVMFVQLIRRNKADSWTALSLSLALGSLYLVANALLVRGTLSAFAAMASYSLVWASYSVSSSMIAPLISRGNRGLAYGIYNSVFPLANIIAPLCMGYSIASLGYRLSLILLSAVALVIALIAFLSRPLRSRINKAVVNSP